MRFLCVLLTLILCVFIFVGCQTKEIPSANNISESLKELSPKSVNWVLLDDTSIATYFGISDKKIKSFSGYISSSEERFDMIAVFEYEDKQTRQIILDSIVSLTKQMSDNYKLANKIEVAKITAPCIAETDNTIIFCVLDNYSTVNDYIKNQLDAKIIN